MGALLGFASQETKRRQDEEARLQKESKIPTIETVSERLKSSVENESLMSLYEAVPEAAPPKTNSLMELYGDTPVSENYYIKNEMKRGLVDIATLPGLVPDAVAGLANILSEPFRGSIPEVGDLKGGTKDIAKAFKDSGFVEDLKPPSDGARYKASVARYSVPMLITGPFIATLNGLTKAQKGAAILVEALSSVGGGVGAEVGADVAEIIGYDPDAGRAIGGFVGSVAPTASPTIRAAGYVGGKVKNVFSDDVQKAAGKTSASKMLAVEMDNAAGAEQNLKNYERLKEKYPDFEVSIGAATDAKGVLSIQTSLAEKRSDYLAYAANMDLKARNTITSILKKDFPDANTYDITNASSKLYKKVIGDLDAGIVKAQNQEKKLTEAVLKNVPKPEQAATIGVQLRVLREEQRLKVRASRNLRYEALYKKAETMGIEDDVTDIISFVENKMNADGRTFQNSPAAYKKVMDEWGSQRVSPINPLSGAKPKNIPVEVSFEELHSLYKQVGKEYRAIKFGPDEAMKRDLLSLKEKLIEKINVYEGSMFGDFAADFKAANKFNAKEYQAVFFEGSGGLMKKQGAMGYTTSDESVVRSIFLKDRKGAEDFKLIYGNDKAAQELLLNGILDVFRKDVVKDGVIQTNKLHTFNKNYGAEIAQFPEINNIINNAGELAKRLADRQAFLRDAITKSKGSQLKKLTGILDVDSLLNRVIKDPKAMKSLLNTIGDSKEGIQALAHVTATKVSQQKAPYQYFMDNKKALKPILDKLGPSHAKKIEDIAEMMEITNRFDVPKGVNVSLRPKDMVEEAIGTSGKSIFSQLRFAQQGKMSYPYIIVDVSGKMLFKMKQAETERLLNSAFYDTNQAKFLLDFAKNSKLVEEAAKKSALARGWNEKAVVIQSTKKFTNLLKTNLYLTGALSASRANQFLEEDEED